MFIGRRAFPANRKLRFMRRGKYFLCSGVAVFFAATMPLRADFECLPNPGYLPSVGPAALRFRAPQKPFKSIVLPKSSEMNSQSAAKTDSIPMPTPKTEILPAPVIPQTQTPAETQIETPAVQTSESQTSTNASPPETNMAAPESSVPPPASVPKTQSEPAISPQMFLKFFSAPSGGATVNGGVIGPSAPVEFKSPQSAAPPSSKATYSTSP